jgi:hypothetical protein
MLVRKESRRVNEGWVSDEAHSLWSDLAYGLKDHFDCDVWINDMGWMELSNLNGVEDTHVFLYIKWTSPDRGEVIAESGNDSISLGYCTSDRAIGLSRAIRVVQSLVG